jgi:SPX domain protein involved in polyphosphate accumulation
MYENVFRRVEEKYVLDGRQKQELLKKIESYLQKDKFYKTTICNLYFDTIHDDLIVHSLEKPIFKEKIRLRSYKIPDLEDDVFLEIKKKYKGIVGKRRVKMKLKEFYEYIKNHEFDETNQIMREIDYAFTHYQLKPTIYIAYDRKSYVAKENKHLRITFDENLRSRTDDLRLELGDAGFRYFKGEYYIMEIKTLGAMPMWLVHALSDLNIYPTSFSKYGSIYEKKKERKINYAY